MCHKVGGRGVDRESEEVLRLSEIRDQAPIFKEVDEAEDVGGEGGHENDVEDALPWLGSSRGVVFCLDGCVEALDLGRV
jgi:hypothetical protein